MWAIYFFLRRRHLHVPREIPKNAFYCVNNSSVSTKQYSGKMKEKVSKSTYPTLPINCLEYTLNKVSRSNVKIIAKLYDKKSLSAAYHFSRWSNLAHT